MTQKPRVGGQVEMLDGSHKGIINEVQGEHCLLITWDDGETGHVHPDDINYLDRAVEPCMSQMEISNSTP